MPGDGNCCRPVEQSAGFKVPVAGSIFLLLAVEGPLADSAGGGQLVGGDGGKALPGGQVFHGLQDFFLDLHILLLK